jgi:roadblock/LC7 domain-containing protein
VVQLGGLADTVQVLLASLTQGAAAGATPRTAASSVALDDLLSLDGVVFAVAFGPDGSVLEYRSEIDIPQAEIEQAAAAGPALSALLAVAAQRYEDVSALEWSPPSWVVYSGGPRWTVILAGNVAVIAETAAVDFNALYAALVGPR